MLLTLSDDYKENMLVTEIRNFLIMNIITIIDIFFFCKTYVFLCVFDLKQLLLPKSKYRFLPRNGTFIERY